MKTNDLLIIGAGPFGISLAILAKHYGLNYTLFGKPAEFFRSLVPSEMTMRSFVENHVDPLGEFTIERFGSEIGLEKDQIYPINTIFYSNYIDWLVGKYDIKIESAYVSELSKFTNEENNSYFEAIDESGEKHLTKSAVIAIGQKYFYSIPKELSDSIPSKYLFHSSQVTDFTKFRNKSVLIVGGRQSAFEWAAFLSEAGAREVHLTYRHDTPTFKDSDFNEWKEIFQAIDSLPESKNTFLELNEVSQNKIKSEFFSLGRLHIEGWLENRISSDRIFMHPNTNIVKSELIDSNQIQIELSDKTKVLSDFVIAATGFKPEIGRVPFLTKGNIIESLITTDGSPILSNNFESNINGLYFTSSLASHSLGPYFNLTMPACVSAKAIISRILLSPST